jgi:putative ABC transport system permease protein
MAIGVSAVVGVSLFSAHVEYAVFTQAKSLLGGDLEIRSSHPLSAESRTILDTLDQRGITRTHVSELVAMAARATMGNRAAQATQIVELKAVERAYPLYGVLKIDPSAPLERLLYPDRSECETLPCHGAVVQEALLLRMGLMVGNRLRIGTAQFVITGVVRTEPDRMANAFSLGPRVIISEAGLKASGLVQPGSRVRERELLRLAPDMPYEPLRAELRGRLAADHVRVSGYRDAQPQLKQFLEQLSRYLGLIGLTALFIGGVGVGMSIHAFMQEKLKAIAILKTLGADSSILIGTYVLQAIGLGLIGSTAGMLLGIGVQSVFPPLLAGAFVTDLLEQVGASTALSMVSIGPLLKGGALGLLTTLLFSLWPLLRVRDVAPSAIFRRELDLETDASASKLSWRVKLGLQDRFGATIAGALILGLAGLSIWQAGSWRIGGWYVGGVALAVLTLMGCARLVVSGLHLIPKPASITLRYAIGNVLRPGGHTAGILVAIGLSVMVIVTVSLVERGLLRQVGESRPVDAPTFFFIDLQPDQTAGFARLIRERTAGRMPEMTPLVRSRLHAVNGEEVKVDEERDQEDRRDEESKEERRRQWYLSREYVLTFLDQLPKGNEITRGAWWQPGQHIAAPQVSIEEEAARALGLDVGSQIELDIQGATIRADVSSIRKVDWGNFSTNFYMILSPGSLDGAPITYVATIRVDPDLEVPLQQAVVEAFPNVSAIHVGDVLRNFANVLDRLALAIRAVALFCVVTGGLVMAAALAATRYRRLYESVILKALGATRGLIAKTFAAEYALLGFVGGSLAVALSSALSWLVLTHVLDLTWSLHPMVLFIGLMCTVVLTLMVGLLSTFRILGEKPLAILRHE